MRFDSSILISLAFMVYLTAPPTAQSQTECIVRLEDPQINEAKYKSEIDEGVATFKASKYDEAALHFKTAMTLKPESYLPYYNLGVLFIQTKEYQLAVDTLRLAHDRNPTHARLCGYLGLAFEKSGNYDQAIRYYRISVGLNPSAEINNNLGNVFFYSERYEDAANAFSKALRLKPNFHESLGGLCLSQTALRLYEKALDTCIEAFTAEPNSASLQYLVGYAYYHLNRYEEALTNFQTATKLSPRSAEILNGVGFSYLQLNKYPDAMNYFKEALALDPKSGEARAGIGATYFRLKKYKLAGDYYRGKSRFGPVSLQSGYDLFTTEPTGVRVATVQLNEGVRAHDVE